MKRLMFLSAALCGLLTACPQPPEIVKVPGGESVLNGEWRGTLTPDVEYALLTQGGGRLYVNRIEGQRGGGWFSRPTRSPLSTLAVLDAQTGQVLKQLPWSDAGYVKAQFRAATATLPARLLILDGQSIIIERDPLTLAETDRWVLPSAFWHFNAEGTQALLSDRRVLDTRTRQLRPAHPELQKKLEALPRDTQWSTDLETLVVTEYEQKPPGKVSRYTFLSQATGASINGLPLHPLACGVSLDNSLTSQALTLPDGGLALAYRDGVIELRRADGTLRTAVDTGDCQRVELTLQADQLRFSGKTLGTVRLSDGKITAQVPADAPDAARLSILGELFTVKEGVLKYQQTGGASWQLGSAPKSLWLKANATWVSKSEYHVTGEARIGDEALKLTAKAIGAGIEFQPQTMQAQAVAIGVGWQGELRRVDGSLYARLSGEHGSRSVQQSLFMSLEGPDQDFAYRGQLKR